MILKKLVAKNVGRYSELEHEFKSGVTLIQGKNGHGKSTILDAIEFALDGSCGKSKKLIYFKKRNSKSDLEVTLDFEFNGKEWQVYRSFDGKSSSANLKINGELIANSPENVNNYFENNFVSMKLLRNSNLVSQKSTAGILDSKPAERFAIAKSIFDTEKYSSKVDKIKSDITEKTDLVASSLSQITSLEKDITSLSEKIKSFDKTSVVSLIAEAEKTIKIMEEGVASRTLKAEGIKKDIDGIDATNKEITQHNSKLSDFKLALAENESKLDTAKANVLAVTTSIASKKSEKNLKELALAEMESSLSSIKLVRLAVYDSSNRNKLVEEKSKITADISVLQDKLNLCKSGNCPTCGQSTTGLGEGDLQKQIDECKQKVEEIKLAILKEYDSEKLYEDQKKQNDDLRESKQKLTSEIESLKSKIENLKEQISYEEVTKLPDLNATIKSLESAVANSKLEVASFVTKDLLDKSKKVLELESAQKDILLAEGHRNQESKRKDELVKTLSEHEIFEGQLKDKTSTKQGLEKSISNLTETLKVMEDVKVIFEKKLPAFIVTQRLKSIESVINKFLSRVDPHFSVSFGVSAKNDLDIIIHDNYDNEESDYSNLSGFEANLVGIAIRVGLAHYNSYVNKTPIHWLALDEPDKSCDTNNSSTLFESIFNELSAQFQQVFVITHKEELFDKFQFSDVIRVAGDGNDSFVVRTKAA